MALSTDASLPDPASSVISDEGLVTLPCYDIHDGDIGDQCSRVRRGYVTHNAAHRR